MFCPPCRTEKKMSWWNWGRRLERSVLRAQKARAGITDPEKVVGTVNQKIVQKGQRKVRRTSKRL